MSTKTELKDKIVSLQNEIECTKKELTKIEKEEIINVQENDEIKSLIIKLTCLYKEYDIPFELRWPNKLKSVIIFNTFKYKEQENFSYNTIDELKSWFEKQIFLTKIYKELFKNFIGRDVFYLQETNEKNKFTFRACGYQFVLELRSNKKVKTLTVLYTDYSSHIQMLFDHYGVKLDIEGRTYENEYSRDCPANFNVNISTTKENFDLTELSTITKELVDKLELFPQVKFKD